MSRNVYKLARAHRVLEVAKGMVQNQTDHSVANRLNEIRLYADETNVYAEHSYTGTLAAVGNWNTVDRYDAVLRMRQPVRHGDLPARVGNLLEKLGFDTEWSDEWTECEECGKLLRTQPDSHFWKPSYVASEDTLLCLNCAPADEEDSED